MVKMIMKKKKEKWRKSVEEAFQQMLVKQEKGQLSKAQLRCAVYAGAIPVYEERDSFYQMAITTSDGVFGPRRSFLELKKDASSSSSSSAAAGSK